VRLVFGLNAHRRWHYTLDQQPIRFVKWFVRSVDAPKPETLANLGHSLVAWLTGNKPPWTLEAEEAEAAEQEEQAAPRPPVAPSKDDNADYAGLADSHAVGGVYHGQGGHHEATATVESAVELRNAKRRLTAAGLVGVYIVWALFTWCAGWLRALAARASLAHAAAPAAGSSSFTECCATSCWATRRRVLLRAPGASATASEQPRNGRRVGFPVRLAHLAG
jgi:hypothetical protein